MDKPKHVQDLFKIIGAAEKAAAESSGPVQKQAQAPASAAAQTEYSHIDSPWSAYLYQTARRRLGKSADGDPVVEEATDAAVQQLVQEVIQQQQAEEAAVAEELASAKQASLNPEVKEEERLITKAAIDSLREEGFNLLKYSSGDPIRDGMAIGTAIIQKKRAEILAFLNGYDAMRKQAGEIVEAAYIRGRIIAADVLK